VITSCIPRSQRAYTIIITILLLPWLSAPISRVIIISSATRSCLVRSGCSTTIYHNTGFTCFHPREIPMKTSRGVVFFFFCSWCRPTRFYHCGRCIQLRGTGKVAFSNVAVTSVKLYIRPFEWKVMMYTNWKTTRIVFYSKRSMRVQYIKFRIVWKCRKKCLVGRNYLNGGEPYLRFVTTKTQRN